MHTDLILLNGYWSAIGVLCTISYVVWVIKLLNRRLLARFEPYSKVIGTKPDSNNPSLDPSGHISTIK